MEGEALKYGWLIVLTLASIINIWMKMAEKRNGKKNDESHNPGKLENPSHGERLMGLETDVENLKENNEKDHRLIRVDIKKLSNFLNGMRRPGK